MMGRNRKWWPVSTALATVVFLVMATGTSYASPPAGEESTWHPQVAGGSQISSADSYHEAWTDNNTKVGVWRGLSDNAIYVSVNGGSPFTIGSIARTVVSPYVINMGAAGAAIFHTGIDRQIYYSYSENPLNGGWSTWQVINNNQFTEQSVAAARFAPRGSQSRALMITYRGAGNDTRLFTSWNGDARDPAGWSGALAVPGDTSYAAPSLTYAATNNTLWLTHVGTNRHIYTQRQPVGSSVWGTPADISFNDVAAYATPASAFVSCGDEMQWSFQQRNIDERGNIDIVDYLHGHILQDGNLLMELPSVSENLAGWATDGHAPTLTQNATTGGFAQLTGQDHRLYWQRECG